MALVVGILALIVSVVFNILQYKWRKQEREERTQERAELKQKEQEREAEQHRKEQAPPKFYNAAGNPGPITLNGIQHSNQGPFMDVWGLVTIVNPTQSPMKISLRRFVLAGKEMAIHHFFFRLKSDPRQRFERISLMGNDKDDYELHLMFPDNNYPCPPSREGELWVSSDNREAEFPVKVMCP